jgi:hypothetical protein
MQPPGPSIQGCKLIAGAVLTSGFAGYPGG